MKLGQLLDKVDSWNGVKVDIWVKCKEYVTVCGIPQYVTKEYHTVHEKPMYHDEVRKYRDNTLVNCFITNAGDNASALLEITVKE